MNGAFGHSLIYCLKNSRQKSQGSFPVTALYGFPEFLDQSFHQGLVSLVYCPSSQAAAVLPDG